MFSEKLARNILVAVVIVAIALGIAWANKWNERRKHALSPRCKTTAKLLLTKAMQYGAQATQDDNPMYALMHVNYALGYVEAARTIATDEQLAELVSYEPHALYQALLQAQQSAMTMLANYCTAQSQPPPQSQAQSQAQSAPAPPSYYGGSTYSQAPPQSPSQMSTQGPQPMSAGMF